MSSQFPTTSRGRLCKNCRHFTNDHIVGPKYGKCALTLRMIAPTVNPVDGAHVGPVRELMFASTQRGVHGDCGEEGILYEHEADALVRFRNAWQVPVTDMVVPAMLMLYLVLGALAYTR